MTFETSTAVTIVLVLLVFSAVLSAAKTGLADASRIKLADMAKRGITGAKSALALLDAPERLPGALLLANNLVTIAIAATVTAAFIRNSGGGGSILAAIAVTALLLLAIQVFPRTIAGIAPERVAAVTAPFIRVVAAVFSPVTFATEAAARAMLRLAGAKVDESLRMPSAHDELRGAIDLHRRDESLVKEERDRLGGILDLKDLEVADIMVHRTKMNTLDLGLPPQEIVSTVLASPHTRMPVWRGKPDNIVGVLHAKALFAALQAAGGDASKVDLDRAISEAWFVPDTRPLEDQLNAFLRRKVHFALVVDEYGEVEGLVTLEDILEEIVGDIKDEFDAVSSGVRKTRDGAYMIDGTVPVRDLNREFDWSLPDDEATTLAGLVIHEARMIPDAGQVFSFHGFKFEVVKKRKQQITQIKLTRLDETPQDVQAG